MTFRHSFRLTLARCNIPSVFYPQIDIYPNLLHISEDFLLHNATCKNASIRLRESYDLANMIKSPCHMIQVTCYVKYDDVRRDSMINFMLTWHKLSLLIGHFEV
jgi:hypothetical protein